MKRREFLRRAGYGSLAALTSAGTGVIHLSCRSKKKRQPNIIFILADDLGYGDLSCYGQSRFQTPHLDRMAGEGMRFIDHYSGSTVCAPARCSLMTGYHTGHARVRGNYASGPHGWGACLELRSEDLTVSEILKKAGYATGAFGKWSLGVAETTGAPWKKGFDEWYGYLNQGHAHFYYPEYLYHNDKKVMLEGNTGGKRQQYSHDLIAEKALEFVAENKDQPFFLYWAITIPHAELLVPEDSLEEFRGRYEEKPYVGTHYASQEEPRAAFAGMVTRMDRDIGRLLKMLEELGIVKDTIVMFSSDNGPHKEGGHDPEFFGSNRPLRGIKRDLYEGGIRVPMIARWPGRIQAGTTTHHVSAFWDFLPTVCDLVEITSPDGIDGLSFLPAMLGDEKEQREHEVLYWEFHERKTTNQAIRMGRWKAIRHSPTGPIELYDLETDIGETANIADQNPEIVGKIRAHLEKTRTPHEIWELKS
ncbi:MAG: arylsulfatase [Candidatus Aminicenantes bacterium]|nr:MAG: arylsulfatase [Candidatus Aminicenantes bacterium]